MDEWMDGWIDGWMDGWMDGMDRKEYSIYQALKCIKTVVSRFINGKNKSGK